MRIYLEAFDSNGDRLGDGPITTLAAAQVTRLLDGVGTIQFETPATDKRALDTLLPRVRFRLYSDNQNAVREIGRGIILKRELREAEGGAVLVFECADALVDLKNRTTHLARTYSQQTVGALINDLIGLVPDWSADVDAGIAAMVIDARFDGVSVLDALIELCKNNGIHFRLAAVGNVVEVGAFGADSGVLALNAEVVAGDIYQRENAVLVQTLNAGDDSEELVNWIVPLGAGEDAAALTLENSTRTSPYTIQTGTGPDGRTYWYLEDAASVVNNGRIEQYVTFKNITAISNTDADKIAAANALYDAAVAYLERIRVMQKTYTLGLVGVKNTLRTGDKLGVRYRGSVMKNGEIVDYAHIDEAMYLLRVSETFSVDDTSVSVDVSNVDMAAYSIEEAIVSTMNEIALNGLRPAVGMSCRTYVYPREIAPSAVCRVPVEITNATLNIIRARVRLKTMPMRVIDHRHMVMERVAVSGVGTSTYLQVRMAGDSAAGVSTSALLFPVISDPGFSLYTQGPASGAISGVVDDTQTPSGISVWVDGIDRTVALGGPFAPSGGALNILLDVGLMTDYIINAAGGMYAEHTVEFRCTGGLGRCEVTVEIYEVLQGIFPQ